MLDFCKRTTKSIYIYGYSKRGKLMYQYLTANKISVKGFVISDNQEKLSKCPVPMYFLKEIDGKNAALIMGISYCWFNEIFSEIVKKQITDIYFLTKESNYAELQKYDDWFFEKHEDESEVYLNVDFSYNMAKKIFRYLLDGGMQIKKAIDFGGGTGAWLRALKDLNGSSILVLDGSSVSRSAMLEEKEFIQCDFTKGNLKEERGLKGQFDLAVSIEVAEHLDSVYADDFIANLCAASEVILFSAAIKYQGGNHHVNEQMQSYWAEKFKMQGYKPLDCIRREFWTDEEIDGVVRQNCLLYIKENIYERYADMYGKNSMPVDVVHPDVYTAKMWWFQEGGL